MTLSPLVASCLLAAVNGVLMTGCSDAPEKEAPPQRQQLSGVCMGTTWSATLTATPERAWEAHSIIQAELDKVDAALSTWIEDSDLSRITRAAAGEAVSIQPVTYDVLAASERWVEETGGTFDPTVGPLVALWGFAKHEATAEAPSEGDVAAARAKLGWPEIELTETSVTKGRGEIGIDASAIAKGYSVDIAASALEAAGYSSFLIEVGGEIVVRGKGSGDELWKVGINDPLPPEGSDRSSPMALAPRQHIARLHITDRAVATSGDYFNVRVVDGREVTHAIDPRTGRPVDHALASVTVIAEDCASADALATAALVLGPDAALALLEGLEDVEALLLVRTPDAKSPIAWRQTSGLDQYKLERR